MVQKYEAFSEKCLNDYIQKIQNPTKIFVEQKEKEKKQPGSLDLATNYSFANPNYSFANPNSSF